MRVLPYLLYLFLITFHTTILSDLTSILGVHLNLLILIIVMIGLFKSETEAVWFGLSAGIIVGAARLDLMPWEVLIITVIAIAVKQVSARINLESLASKVVVLASSVFLHEVIISLIISPSEFLFILVRFILPGTAYTVLVGLILFLIKDGRISKQKIKALF
ncbi:MAG: hypothetical protein GY865_00250 [candidate division Zixibacteria bacterium]|nr:hypothetical protein [candidate division Zixibacteria bacterium]